MAGGTLLLASLCWWAVGLAIGGSLGGLFEGTVNGRGPPFLTKSGLSDQTEYVKLDELGMSFLAFGDFNRDRFMDALVYDPHHPQVASVALWDHLEYKFSLAEKEPAITLPEEITSATVADFDDDGDLDVLLTVAKGSDAYIYGGNRAGGFTLLETLPNLAATDQFLVMDADGNFKPDILVMRPSGSRGFYRAPATGSSEFRYVWVPWPRSPDGADQCVTRVPFSSHAFVDINGDCLPDLVLTTSCGLEVWLNSAGDKKFWDLQVTDTEFFHLLDRDVWNPDEGDGQIAFADFNGDGTNDLAVANEEDMNVRVYLNKQVTRRYGFLCISDPAWRLEIRIAVSGIKLTPQRLAKNFHVPGALRVGDFNFDGLPDFLALTSGKIELFENIGNWKDVTSAPHFKKFGYDEALHQVDDAVAAAFIDLDESGRQDIVVVQSHGTRLIWNNYNKHADSLFFKATGLSSLSYFGQEPRPFAPVPGTTFKLSFDSPDGKVQYTCSQCPQSAYLPLQSCSCLFGLVRISNYIEEMAMGGAFMSRSWVNLMPNSMTVIWPDLSEGTKSWWMEYFTQQRFDQIQGVVSFLITSLLCLVLAIWYLTWQERKQDRIEQLVRATAFHL